MPRRRFLGVSCAGVAGLCLAGEAAAAPATVSAPALPSPSAKKGLRICFFTDAHLPSVAQSTVNQQKRIRRAFDLANAFKPQAYVFGGDNVFNVDKDGVSEADAKAQFDSWKAAVKEKVSVPHHSVIGNHDIWGQGDNQKALAIATFGMPSPYYSWKMGGWKFIMLDVYGKSGGMREKTKQGDWLEAELAKDDDTPTCIVTHSPMMGLTARILGGGGCDDRDWRKFFYRFPQVRLALSGHQHMVDCCRLDRVTYICGGAVSASWWNGDYEHFAPAFLILDLKPDGTFDHQEVYWERDSKAIPKKAGPPDPHKDLYNF